MKFCSTCGAEAPADANFCGACGAALTRPSEVSQPVASDSFVIHQRPPDDFTSARRLSDALRQGWRPPTIKSQIAMAHKEGVIAETPATHWLYNTQNAQSGGGQFIAFGSPALLLASIGGSVAYNAWRANQTAKFNAAQWRQINSGTLVMSTSRIALAGTNGWDEYHYEHLRSVDVDVDGVVVFVNGKVRMKFVMWNPLTHAVLLRFLAFNEIPDGVDEPASQGIASSIEAISADSDSNANE